MKKLALFLALFMMFSCVYAHAALKDEMNSQKALYKFSRGVTNIATSPGEVINQMPVAMEESPDYLSGFITAAGRGIGYTLLRFGAGVYDLATFPFPGKTNYGPIMQPETIVTKIENTTLSDPK